MGGAAGVVVGLVIYLLAPVMFQVLGSSERVSQLGTGYLRMRTLVTQGARLTLYQGSELGELFDLESDCTEMTNLFARPEGRDLRFDLTERLARRMMELADEAPKPTHVA